MIEAGEYKALFQEAGEVELLPDGGRIELWLMSGETAASVDGLSYAGQSEDHCWTWTGSTWEEQQRPSLGWENGIWSVTPTVTATPTMG